MSRLTDNQVSALAMMEREHGTMIECQDERILECIHSEDEDAIVRVCKNCNVAYIIDSDGDVYGIAEVRRTF